MTEHGIYTRIVQITEAHFGQPVTPHMFRTPPPRPLRR